MAAQDAVETVSLTPPVPSKTFRGRFFNRSVMLMLVRNSVVSYSAFAVGLLVLWILVGWTHFNPVFATAVSFIVANAVHYLAGRSWIFRGTKRPLASGYVYFLVNGGIGLVITLVLFDALLRFTTINYLVIRVLVSLVAGLVMFALNGVLNFRRI